MVSSGFGHGDRSFPGLNLQRPHVTPRTFLTSAMDSGAGVWKNAVR